jgi:sulfate adenylyltransferase subunit 2
MGKYNLNHLKQLEAEAIHIIRETVAEARNPVMLYSIGKDSSVLLKLAQKAFYPDKIPFPLLHIDTGFKFKEMIEFRDKITKKVGVKLIVHQNKEKKAMTMNPEEAHTDSYIYYKKTKPLLEVIQRRQFDAAICGARRDEEKSRAKERIFSLREEQGTWNPKKQRPELWHLYNTKLQKGQNMRVFPLSNWTEFDIWNYIKKEKIEVVPLYFAKKRKVVKRDGNYFRVDEFVKPKKGEKVTELCCRYRTLGCSPSTGAIPSQAKTIDEIIKEVFTAKNSERQNRAIDKTSDSAMEDKKREGYF